MNARRSRCESETAVGAAFPGVVIIRPAVLFARDDGFLTEILRLLRILPAYSMFGDGRTQLQPAYAGDVAAAITQVLRQSKKPYPMYALAGPRVYSYQELVRIIEYRRIAAGADADALCVLGRRRRTR